MLDEPFERAWCSLLGLAVGDAFGETMAEGDVAKRIAKRLLLRRRPWRWTDDTAMALSIVELLGRHGTIDPDALAAAFVRRWQREPDRGYGLGAFQLLHRVHAGAAWRVEARGLFGGQGSFGNGAAMRAAPIGAYFALDLERVRVEALRSAEPTHAHPDGAAGAVAVAIAAALATTGIARDALLGEVIRWTPDSPTRTRLQRATELSLDFELQLREAPGVPEVPAPGPWAAVALAALMTLNSQRPPRLSRPRGSIRSVRSAHARRRPAVLAATIRLLEPMLRGIRV